MAQIFRDDDHDTVVKKYAELVQKNNPEQFRVFTILTKGNDIKLGGLTPDIVLNDNEGNKVITVIEVRVPQNGGLLGTRRGAPVSGGTHIERGRESSLS